MLNCTDLACVLHHHHFYAHLHHLKHHLQDDNDHSGMFCIFFLILYFKLKDIGLI